MGGSKKAIDLLAGNAEWEALMVDHGTASPELLEILGGLFLEKIRRMKEPMDSDGEGTSSKTKTTDQAGHGESEHLISAASMKEGGHSVPDLAEMPEISINIEKMHIPIFDGKNFSTWADKFEMMMRSARLWKFFTGQWSAPEEGKAMTRYVELNFMAYATLHRSCDDVIQKRLKKFRDEKECAQKAWEYLNEVYVPREASDRAKILDLIVQASMEAEETMDHYCNRMAMYRQDYERAGGVMAEEQFCTYLAKGVPSTYDDMLRTMEMMGKGRTEYELSKLLKKEEERLHRREKETSRIPFAGATKAVMGRKFPQARNNNGDGPRSLRTGLPIHCYHCRGPHKVLDCPTAPEDVKSAFKLRFSSNRGPPAAGEEVKKALLMHAQPPKLEDTKINTQDGEDHEVVRNWMVKVEEEVDLKSWYLDTGCTQHCTPVSDFIYNMRPSSVSHMRVANKDKLLVAGEGDIYLKGAHGEVIKVSNVLYVPEVAGNLLSFGQLTEQGVMLIMDPKKRFRLIDDYGQFIGGRVDKRMMIVEATASTNSQISITSEFSSRCWWTIPRKISEAELWHRRLGHLHARRLHQLMKDSTMNGVSATPEKYECPSCVEGKMTRFPFPKQGRRVTQALERIHMDVCGPFPTPTIHGHLYFMVIVDDWSRYVWACLLKTKGEAVSAVRSWLNMVDTKYRKKVEEIRSDNGGEFLNNELKGELLARGISHQRTVPFTPQQNGVAERANRTLQEGMLCMMLDMQVAQELWGHAIMQFTWIKNRMPSASIGGSIPLYRLQQEKPDLRMVRVFGCIVQYKILDRHLGKLSSKAKWGLHLGVGQDDYVQTKGWRVMDLQTKRVTTAREVCFYEGISQATWLEWKTQKTMEDLDNTPGEFLIFQVPSPLSAQGKEEKGSTKEVGASMEGPEAEDKGKEEEQEPNREEEQKSSDDEEEIEEREIEEVEDTEDQPYMAEMPGMCITDENGEAAAGPRRSSRQRVFNRKYDDYVTQRIYKMTGHTETGQEEAEAIHRAAFGQDIEQATEERNPTTLKEALSMEDGEEWRKAAEEEMSTIKELGTFELVHLPQNRRALDSRWVFVKKELPDMRLKFKARLVVRGFNQIRGMDYDFTYAPVADMTTIRTFFTLVTMRDLELWQWDVKNAFLHGVIDKEVFMTQPDGYDDGSGRVWKLKKSLYGLKQAPMLWYQTISRVLEEAGFVKSEGDAALFSKGEGEGKVWLLIYVDDILAASKSEGELRAVTELLESKFIMKQISPVQKYLGMEIERRREKGELFLHQKRYLEKLMGKVATTTQRPPQQPISNTNFHSKDCSIHQGKDREEYSKMLGYLGYAAGCTRPDVAFAYSRLGQGTGKGDGDDIPDVYWVELKRALQYAGRTTGMKLRYSAGGEEGDITCYADSDDASDFEDRRSRSGILIMLGGNLVLWKSRKQGCTTLSSAESEYAAITSCVKELEWFLQLTTDFNINVNFPVRVFSDSQSAISLAKLNDLQGRSKHMGRRLFWLRERVRDGKIQLTHIGSHAQPADFLTKVLPTKAFQRCSNDVGLIDIDLTRAAYLLTTTSVARRPPAAARTDNVPVAEAEDNIAAATCSSSSPPPVGTTSSPTHNRQKGVGSAKRRSQVMTWPSRTALSTYRMIAAGRTDEISFGEPTISTRRPPSPATGPPSAGLHSPLAGLLLSRLAGSC